MVATRAADWKNGLVFMKVVVEGDVALVMTGIVVAVVVDDDGGVADAWLLAQLQLQRLGLPI